MGTLIAMQFGNGMLSWVGQETCLTCGYTPRLNSQKTSTFGLL